MQTSLQFIKTTSAKAVDVSIGSIYFLTDTNTLAVGIGADGSTSLQYFSGVRDASFDSSTKVLSITRPDGENFTLDFSDVASAEGVNSLLGTLRKDLNLDTSILGASTDEHAAGKYNFAGTEDVSYIQGEQTVRESLVLLDKGIQNAMANAGVTEFGGKRGVIYIDSSNATDGSIVFSMDGSTLKGTVHGIKDSAFAGMYTGDVSSALGTDGSIAAVGQVKTYVDYQDSSLYDKLIGDAADTSANNTILGTKNYIKDVEDHLVEAEYVTASALVDLDERLKAAIAGGVNDLKVNGVSVKDASATANLSADGIYDASDNKLATVSTVTSAIDGIEGAGLSVDASGKITAVTQAAGDASANVATTKFVTDAVSVEDASIAKWLNTQDVSTGTGHDSSLTSVSQVKTYVTNYVNSLDASAVIATVNSDIITLKAGLTETNGVIANSSDADITLAKVAKTGNAVDVAYADASGVYTATNVEDALTEVMTLAKSTVGGMRYNGDVSTATLSVNKTTNDIRPGDTYIATGSIVVEGVPSIESGDLIVYKGEKSTVDVSINSTNVTVIERETDDMVTAAGTLTVNHVILGADGKGVKISEITDASLTEAVNGVKAVSGESALTTTNGYVQVSVIATPQADSRDVSLSTNINTTIGDVSTATADASGLATAYSVQQYVQNAFTWAVFE